MTLLSEAGKGKVTVKDSDEERHPKTEAVSSGEIRVRVIPGSEAYREAVKELMIGRLSYDEFIALLGLQESDDP